MLSSEYESLCALSGNRLTPRGRLTEKILELTEPGQDPGPGLHELGGLLEDVLSQDMRFPFHLAAYVCEKCAAPRLAVALLVEGANRVAMLRRRSGRPRGIPFSLRPLVMRVVRTGTDAAYAMAYQVRHFGWSMPAGLRQALREVVSAQVPSPGGDDAEVPPSRIAGRVELFERTPWLRGAEAFRSAVAH